MSIGGLPRGCGVTVQGTEAIYALKGLSPRMRGYPNEPAPVVGAPGSIPVYTGLPQ